MIKLLTASSSLKYKEISEPLRKYTVPQEAIKNEVKKSESNPKENRGSFANIQK